MAPGWAHKIAHACHDPSSSFTFLVGGLRIVVVVACIRSTWGLCQRDWQDVRFGVALAPSFFISSHFIDFSSIPFLACCPLPLLVVHAPNSAAAVTFTHSKQRAGPVP